jgi:hypothetical protein
MDLESFKQAIIIMACLAVCLLVIILFGENYKLKKENNIYKEEQEKIQKLNVNNLKQNYEIKKQISNNNDANFDKQLLETFSD